MTNRETTLKTETRVSRRTFLKGLGAGAAAMAASQLLDRDEVTASEAAVKNGWGILIDLTRCVGCNSCALACKKSNNLPHPTVEPDRLESKVYTFVDERTVEKDDGQLTTRFVKRQCMHCLNPSCVSACPAAAMYQREDGAVVYRAERCLGCRYCQMACPFGIPSFEWDNGLAPVISKCMMCAKRLDEGLQPACAEACPTGALRFGPREELLIEAHARLTSNPNRYFDHVYGETEVGGTSVLYLSDLPFDQLGFRTDLPETAPPEETKKIMTKLPLVITGLTAFLAGTVAYTHRHPAEINSTEEE